MLVICICRVCMFLNSFHVIVIEIVYSHGTFVIYICAHFYYSCANGFTYVDILCRNKTSACVSQCCEQNDSCGDRIFRSRKWTNHYDTTTIILNQQSASQWHTYHAIASTLLRHCWSLTTNNGVKIWLSFDSLEAFVCCNDKTITCSKVDYT